MRFRRPLGMSRRHRAVFEKMIRNNQPTSNRRLGRLLERRNWARYRVDLDAWVLTIWGIEAFIDWFVDQRPSELELTELIMRARAAVDTAMRGE